jgi:hypothetical protein
MKPKTSEPQISMAVRHCGVVVLGVLTSGFREAKMWVVWLVELVVGPTFNGKWAPVKPFRPGPVIAQSCPVPIRLDLAC